MPSVKEVTDDYQSLSDADKVRVADVIGIGAPPRDTVGYLWFLIVGTLCIVVILGLVLVFNLTVNDLDSGVIAGFVGGAIGAIVGLLAPSPVKGTAR
ncbi:MAG TPA: hypothetical protein VFY23_02540 [Candidatus Limnocylindrales bacterium]|nr:hypothetical protein [Candidatus Limnocylindrales bacterium]